MISLACEMLDLTVAAVDNQNVFLNCKDLTLKISFEKVFCIISYRFVCIWSSRVLQ